MKWCEKCKDYVVCALTDKKPKCFTPIITNTAHGTPESYLAKSLRYSRDGHEIAKDEPTISKMEQVDEPKTQMKTQNSNLTFEKADEPQTDCPWK